MQPATIDPILDLCNRYPFSIGWTEAVWNMKLARHFTYGQQWESNHRPSDIGSNALSIASRAVQSCVMQKEAVDKMVTFCKSVILSTAEKGNPSR